MERSDMPVLKSLADVYKQHSDEPAGRVLQDGPVIPVLTDAGYDALPAYCRPINVHTVADAKRLLSRVIREVQKGTMTGKKAKELTYLLSTFVQIAKQSEFDSRLEGIEKRLSIEFGKLEAEEDQAEVAGDAN